MNVKEFARLIGVHSNTAYAMVKEGKVNATKKGKSWDISEEEADKWIENKELDEVSNVSARAKRALQARLSKQESIVYVECLKFVEEYDADLFNNKSKGVEMKPLLETINEYERIKKAIELLNEVEKEGE